MDISLNERWEVEAPSLLKEIGCGGLLKFFVQVYPKIAWKMITDPRFREAKALDEQITKQSQQYMGYVLIVGEKP